VEDFGHFRADLYAQDFEDDDAQRIGRSLVRAYEKAAGWEVPPERLAFHTALHALNQVYRCLSRLRPALEERTIRLIGHAERWLDSG
jgi:hypothetical protein